MDTVRVRGIYATALTRVCRQREDIEVVRASEPIRARFDAEFADTPPEATITTTAGRLGVGISGRPALVERLSSAVGVAVDTLSWLDPAPRGAVFRGRVTETDQAGALIDLGVADSPAGWLPAAATDRSLEPGDTIQLQVREPHPPWTDSRPVLGPAPRVDAGLVTLTRGGSTRNDEAARLATLLSVDIPDGWGARWAPGAPDAGMDAMRAALERALEGVDTLERATAEPPATTPARLATLGATRWCWFGRASRFALDEARRAVTPTMPGHHRIKAASSGASAAVDLVEAVCEPTGAFPFAPVTRQYGPAEGDRLAIDHGKPAGHLIRLGEGVVTAYDPDGGVTIERQISAGGSYDALDVPREAGDVAITKIQEGRWWYATDYRDQAGRSKGTYLNVCTPLEIFPDAVRYVDLHVDVVREADGTVRRVDDAELTAAVEAGELSEALADRAREVASRIETAL